MTFFNARLPDKVAAGFQGGPEFKTGVDSLANGDEIRNKDWQYPKHRYSAEFGLFTDADRDDLIAAIWNCAGSFGTFRFKDWNDYTVSGSALSVSVGTTDPVQLTKRYTFGGVTFVRDVSLIRRATVYEDGVAIDGSYSDTTGLFTPTAPWGAGDITWSGEFDVLVRFANDYNPLTARHRNARTSVIELVEVNA